MNDIPETPEEELEEVSTTLSPFPLGSGDAMELYDWLEELESPGAASREFVEVKNADGDQGVIIRVQMFAEYLDPDWLHAFSRKSVALRFPKDQPDLDYPEYWPDSGPVIEIWDGV